MLNLTLVVGAWAGSAFTVLHAFTGGDDGGTPGGLIADAAGNFYGWTFYGGKYGNGTVYKLTRDSGGGWTQRVIYAFKGGEDGSRPSDVILDGKGNLIGGTWKGGTHKNMPGAIFKLTPSAGGRWKKTTLYSFELGGKPVGPGDLLLDQAGNLYGTAAGGGVDEGGSIFKLTPTPRGNWKETIVYIFPTTSPEGCGPGELIMDRKGNLFGTTDDRGRFGGGSVFELTPAPGRWKLKVLAYGDNTGGFFPVGLTFDRSGNLYGAANLGGTGFGAGTVFKLTPSSGGTWTESVLYNFQDGRDGGYPGSGPVFDDASNLVGSTGAGGGGSCFAPCGVLYRLTRMAGGGWKESVLHEFIDFAGGIQPESSPILDRSGNVYGTTWFGGQGNCFSGSGCGVIYKLTPSPD